VNDHPVPVHLADTGISNLHRGNGGTITYERRPSTVRLTESEAGDSGLVSRLVHLDTDRFDLRRGLPGAALVLIPLVVGFALGLAEASVLVTIGALNLLLVQSPSPATTRWKVLLVAAAGNTIAFGAGTLVGLAPRTVEIPLVAVGIVVPLIATGAGEWESSGFMAAVMFSFAVGIPPTTLAGIGLRPAAVLLGGVWTLAMLSLVQVLRPAYRTALAPPSQGASNAPKTPFPRLAVHSCVTASAVVVGLLIGIALGLPRDYWIMLTVLVALRLDLSSTFGYAAARILGTVAGAGVAFAVTISTADPWLLFPILAVTAVLCLATRGVNYALYAVWITLTVILLLNLVYSGGPSLAIARVIDTLIGGSLALIAAVALAATSRGRAGRSSTTPS